MSLKRIEREHIAKEFRELTTHIMKIKTCKHYIAQVLGMQLNLGFSRVLHIGVWHNPQLEKNFLSVRHFMTRNMLNSPNNPETEASISSSSSDVEMMINWPGRISRSNRNYQEKRSTKNSSHSMP